MARWVCLWVALLVLVPVAILLSGATGRGADPEGVVTLAAYTTPREAYEEIDPHVRGYRGWSRGGVRDLVLRLW